MTLDESDGRIPWNIWGKWHQRAVLLINKDSGSVFQRVRITKVVLVPNKRQRRKHGQWHTQCEVQQAAIWPGASAPCCRASTLVYVTRSPQQQEEVQARWRRETQSCVYTDWKQDRSHIHWKHGRLHLAVLRLVKAGRDAISGARNGMKYAGIPAMSPQLPELWFVSPTGSPVTL